MWQSALPSNLCTLIAYTREIQTGRSRSVEKCGGQPCPPTFLCIFIAYTREAETATCRCRSVSKSGGQPCPPTFVYILIAYTKEAQTAYTQGRHKLLGVGQCNNVAVSIRLQHLSVSSYRTQGKHKLPVHNKVISGFQAFSQARAPVAWLEPVTEECGGQPCPPIFVCILIAYTKETQTGRSRPELAVYKRNQKRLADPGMEKKWTLLADPGMEKKWTLLAEMGLERKWTLIALEGIQDCVDPR
ncbi:hypothetical protein PoB_007426700 [Plakobranchus ocellatus]|uniref:Uncharacterized protein n=1 Tax=Plakobranchus ocellatus TaxID=259542 RepID=A0AAV4DTW3_9GAST|nr:hypothetical protein PoB_007426700 [Plakobranchus ocellatus]